MAAPCEEFHDGQTMSLSVLLGGLTLFLAWKSTRNVPIATGAATAAASLYFLSQGTAIFYPGTAYFDPDAEPKALLGIPAPILIDALYLGAAGVACWMSLRGAPAEERQSIPGP